jgi:hypothetical protein
MYGLQPAVGYGVQVGAPHAIDPAVATDPEIAGGVFGDRKHAVGEESLGGRVIGEAAVLEPAQSAVERPDPHRTIRIVINRPDAIAGQPLAAGERRQSRAVPERGALGSAEPQAAGAIGVDDIDRPVGQAFLGGQLLDDTSVAEEQQALAGADPHRAVGIFHQRIDAGAETRRQRHEARALELEHLRPERGEHRARATERERVDGRRRRHRRRRAAAEADQRVA